MLQALANGKLNRWLTKSPWQIEDLLTAVVFGSCRYAGLDGWRSALHPFLACASRNPMQGSERFSARLPAASLVEKVQYDFWHELGAFRLSTGGRDVAGEIAVPSAIPELLIRLTTADQSQKLLLVEVKLNAPKSSGPSVDARQVTDQLAKYWLHLQRISSQQSAIPLGVVYITQSPYFPSSDIRETREELRKCGQQDAPIFWASWRSFSSAAGICHLPIIEDVCALLLDCWGFTPVEEIERWPTAATDEPISQFTTQFVWNARDAPCIVQKVDDFVLAIWEASGAHCSRPRVDPLWHFYIVREH